MRAAPWQVWWLDFNPQIGREQAGVRPAIVVGTTLACSLPNGLVVVVPCTRTDRKLPWQPAVTLDGTPGFAMCDQIRAISAQRLRERHRGSLSTEEVAAVKFALGQIVDMS